MGFKNYYCVTEIGKAENDVKTTALSAHCFVAGQSQRRSWALDLLWENVYLSFSDVQELFI